MMRYEAVANFTGGMNARTDQLQLANGEFPYAKNIDLDRRGGALARPSWTYANPTAGSRSAPWASSMFQFTTSTVNQIIQASGTASTYTVASVTTTGSGNVFYQTVGGVASPTVTSPTAVGITSSRVCGGVAVAQVGSLAYLALGTSTTGYKWDGAVATALTDPAVSAYQDSYASPTGTHMPKAEFVASHMGFLMAANLNENGTSRLNRVRFSHPNFPQSWRTNDWIDIEDGGPCIRGIFSFNDMLVILKDNAIFGLYGFSADTFQVVKLSTAFGCNSERHACVNQGNFYFFSHPIGVLRMSSKGAIEIISSGLTPLWTSATLLDAIRIAQAHLSFCGGKLRFSINIANTTQESYVTNPFGRTNLNNNSNPSCVFVYDPTVGGWTMHSGAEAIGVGWTCAIDVMSSLGARGPIACIAIPGNPNLTTWLSWYVLIEGTTYTGDQYLTAGTLYNASCNANAANADVTATLAFTPTLRTAWLDGGNSAMKKRWVRPDIYVRELNGTFVTTVLSFRDFDETTATRTASLSLTGVNNTGAIVGRSSPLGTAKAISLIIQLPSAVQAGLLRVVLKYFPRLVRG